MTPGGYPGTDAEHTAPDVVSKERSPSSGSLGPSRAVTRSAQPPTFNPLLGDGGVLATGAGAAVTVTATFGGALRKTLVLGAVAIAAPLAAWSAYRDPTFTVSLFWAGTAVATSLVFLISAHPNLARFIAPAYAAAEGLALGALATIVNGHVPGAGLKALELTFMLALLMLLVHMAHPTVGPSFRRGVVLATVAVVLVYVVDVIALALGRHPLLLQATGFWGVVGCLVVLGVAALNLLLDLAYVKEMAGRGAPAELEWYGAFAILVTLAWIYVQILRVLLALSSDD